MFHAFDNLAPNKALGRAEWMALLSRAPPDLLEFALATHLIAAPQWLRAPETGLMMVQGRAGATGERFNLGEVTVTRCALRISGADLEAALVGVAYVLGRSHRRARLAAVADALLQDGAQHALLEATLLSPIRQHLALQRKQRHARAQTTKVEFFTVAREAGDTGADEETQ
ncbi:MAG: phosphonate lyase system protein PhnG [Polaromonas sp.]|nr:phosphonate lyase system protein PhnG [Polaromonas sp.]